MRRWRFPELALAVALIAPCALAHAQGQTVHRCIGAQGEIEFSGVACATPLPSAAPSSSSASSPMGRSIAPVNCPASVETLRSLIADALARRDANAIAGMMRWNGVGGAAARQRMREIAELAARPMLGIDASGSVELTAVAQDTSGDSAIVPLPSPAQTLLVRTGGSEDGGSREHEFGIVHSDGCYWLDW
jgi:hypothetical protein